MKEEDVDTKAKILDLANHMFKSDGKVDVLTISAMEEFNKNNGIIMTIRGINNAATSMQEFTEVYDEQDRQSEVYDVNFITKPQSNDISPRVKNVLRYIPLKDVNGNIVYSEEFNSPEYYDFDIVNQSVLKDVSGSLSVSEIVSNLEEELDVHPEYQFIIDKIKEDRRFGTAMLQAYNRPLMNYKYIYVTKPTETDGVKPVGLEYKLLDAGKNGVAKSLIQLWKSNADNSGPLKLVNGKTNVIKTAGGRYQGDLKDVLPKLLNKTAEENDYQVLNNILSAIGINDVEISTLKSIVDNNSVTTLKKIFSTYGLWDVFNEIAAGNNPYISTKDIKQHQFFAAFAKVVAKNTPSLFEASHMNIGGEKVYSYVVPSFIHSLIHNITNKAEAARLVANYGKDVLYSNSPVEIGKTTTTNNVILDRVLKILNENINQPKDVVNQKLSEVISISITEGNKDIDNVGKEYTKMADNDLKQLGVNLYFNNGNDTKSVFRVVPLSDSPNMLTIETDRVNIAEGLKGFSTGCWWRV